MALAKWSDIRNEHIERIGREDFEAGKEQMLAEARGWRLAEIRRRRGLTQAQVADRMGVGKSRISQIERAMHPPATCSTGMSRRSAGALASWLTTVTNSSGPADATAAARSRQKIV
jgi:DNA-binding XRE family transcriptional regulator